MARNKSYDEEFKKMIVQLYESHTTTAAEIIREYGIGSSSLYKWVSEYGTIQTSEGEVTNNKKIKKWIVKDQKTRKLEYINMYIYEAKNYKEERKNNLVLIVDWLKKYNYYDIYKILDGIIRIEDAEIIDDLCTILDKTNDEECLKAV